MNIKELREKTGLTQTEFGKWLGIPMRTIQNWEGGQRQCPEYVVELIAFRIEHDVTLQKHGGESKETHTTLAMEGADRFKRVEYKPTCRHGCDDCIYDPAYIKATYPDWYVELYGEKTPEEAALEKNGCVLCYCGERYDDKDK